MIMSVSMNSDFSEVGSVIGSMRAMTETVRTSAYITPVLELAHDRMAYAFDNEIDLISSEGRAQSLQHVYDWPESGSGIKLWKHTLIGAGATREASFEFLPSIRNIPTPTQRAANPNDPMSLIPPEEIAKLSKRNYIFTWKAPIMEYNNPVNIRAKNVNMLFIPTGNPDKPFMFAKSVYVQSPGGNVSTGKFTAFWTDWWSSMPDEVFNTEIKNTLEQDLSNIPIGKSISHKTATLKVNIGMAESMKNGYEATRKYMLDRAAGYHRAVRSTRRSY